MKTRTKNLPGPFASKLGVNGTGVARKKPTRQKPRKLKPTKTRRKPVYTLDEERSHRYRALSFPQAVGKKIARAELVTSGEYHAVVIVFDDNTAVGFEFQPCFQIQAFGENINGVGGAGSKTWPKILSER